MGPTLKVANDPKRHVLLNKQCFHVKFVQRAAVYLRRKKIPKALLKLDISKAFDTNSWPFLLDSLRAFGFGEHWRRWVATLLASASSRILLNGRVGQPI